jgi:hypothetical protein
MGARVEPCRLEEALDIRDDLMSLRREGDRRMGDVPIDVVNAEPDALEMKRRDGAVEGFGLFDEGLQLTGVRVIGAEERDEIGQAALRRLTAVGGHVDIIVECRTWNEDARGSSRRISAKKAV